MAKPRTPRPRADAAEPPPAAEAPAPLLVLVGGMHRSGTSALTRALSLCGLELPRTPQPLRDDNPDGFWESAVVAATNDALLDARQSRWDDIWAGHLSKQRAYSPAEIETAEAVLESEFAFSAPSVLKDPRLSVTYPIWREASEHLGLDARLVIAVRHPLEVADSLLKRNGFPPLKSALLWLTYLLSLERDSRGVRRVFVSYDDLTRNWRGCLRRIERALDISLPRWTAASELEVDKFLARDRRHHWRDAEELDARTDLPRWIHDAYQWALAATREDVPPSADPLDRIAKEFDAAGEMFSPLMAFEAGAGAGQRAAADDPNRFQFTLYTSTAQHPFSEERAVKQTITLGEAPSAMQIASPDYGGEPLTGLRIDPAESRSAFFLYELELADADGQAFWAWDKGGGLFNVGTGIIATPATERGAMLLEFLHADPQINLSAALQGRTSVRLRLKLAAASALDIERTRIGGAKLSDVSVRLGASIQDMGARMDRLEARSSAQLTAAADAMDAKLAATLADIGVQLDANFAAMLGSLSSKVGAEIEELSSGIDAKLAGASAEIGAQLAAASSSVDAKLTTAIGDISLQLDRLDAGLQRRLEAGLAATAEETQAALRASENRAEQAAIATWTRLDDFAQTLAASDAANAAAAARLSEQIAESLRLQGERAAAAAAAQDQRLISLTEALTALAEQNNETRAQSEAMGDAIAARISALAEIVAAQDRRAEVQTALLDSVVGAVAALADAGEQDRRALEALRIELAFSARTITEQNGAAAAAALSTLADLTTEFDRRKADLDALKEFVTQLAAEQTAARLELGEAFGGQRTDLGELKELVARLPTAENIAAIYALQAAVRSASERSEYRAGRLEETLAQQASAAENTARRVNDNAAAATRKFDALDGKIEKLAADMARRAQREEAAARHIAVIDDKLEQLAQDLAIQFDEQILANELQQRISELIRERDEAIAEAQTLRHDADKMRASTSWRVTAPMRALKNPGRFLGAIGRNRRREHNGAGHDVQDPPPLDGERGGDGAPGAAASEAHPASPTEATPPAPASELRPSVAPPPANPDYVPLAARALEIVPPARVIAFYLPQFHPIPENDAWWGEGFTEWTNVRKGAPQFVGHYQPHIPGDLGYYDLRTPEVQERQAKLAKLYGVYGFCFYFYWFAGKRLLESPIIQWRDNRNIDLPYCLCWANENWSRRWDGLDSEVLIAQAHSAEDDLAFIAHIASYLRDPRYIRIDGKPLLIVYRPSLLPAPAETAQRWRAWCRQNGVGEIYLAYTQSFESADPAAYGFDAAIEFPPNNSAPIDITDTVERINPNFAGTVYDYPTFITRSAAYAPRPYTYFRSAFPSWDNEARRVGRGTVYLGSTPALFQTWMRNAVEDAALGQADADRRMVFVNAWNEWAEGAHLEPDQRYGYAWLQSVRDALIEADSDLSHNRIALVVHDAYRHGAQFLALNLAREIRTTLRRQLDIVILGEGPMKNEFAKYGTVHDLAGVDPEGDAAKALALELATAGVTCAICNTTVSALFLKTLVEADIRCVGLVHELPGVLQQYKLKRHVEALRSHAANVIFPSEFVRRAFPGGAPRPSMIRPQGLYKRNGARTQAQRNAARQRLRQHFKLESDAQIVLCVGFADHRKGIDLFIEIGERVLKAAPNAVFLWVGEIEIPLRPKIEQAVARSAFAKRFLFPGFQPETSDFYAGADVYALTSREDPFPTVVMEALDVAVPVVGFAGAGGFVDLLSQGCGLLAPAGDVEAFAQHVLALLGDPTRRQAMGAIGAAKIERDFSFRRYMFDVVAAADRGLKRVSVVVPNYNYAGHLARRLESIRSQSSPIYELVVLDDASNDDSVATLTPLLAELPIDHELIVNARNSGSACRQWLRGLEQARGDLVWIAEADDLSEPDFIRAVLPAFDDPDVVMSYCQSQQMGGDGAILCPHYLDYVADIDPDKWRAPYVAEGLDEIRTVLAVKNTVPNVSACLFRREPLLAAMQEHIEEIARYRVAGDWATYVRLLERGKIAFTPRAMNKHRRHQGSVTIGSFNASLLREIMSMQRAVHERYDPTPEATAKARAYAQELYLQFDLATEAAPHVADNPDFAAYFASSAHAAE